MSLRSTSSKLLVKFGLIEWAWLSMRFDGLAAAVLILTAVDGDIWLERSNNHESEDSIEPADT